MINDYIEMNHGLNLNSRKSEFKNADAKIMEMSGGKIDNENGIVNVAIWKFLLKRAGQENDDLISSLSEICYNRNTGYYSRFNPYLYSPQKHKNDISLDNLIGHVYCNKDAAKRINKKLKFPFYVYDDVEHSRLSRSLILRLDVICYVKAMADDKSYFLFLIPFLILRAISTLTEKVTRPTVYQYLTAQVRRFLGLDYEFLDTKWGRYKAWATSGKALTLIMIDSYFVPKCYKKWTLKKIGSIGALFNLYFTKTGAIHLRPLIELANENKN